MAQLLDDQEFIVILLPLCYGVAGYLNDCRKKRNIVEYDEVGGASESDADELIEFVKDLRDKVINWLKRNHPELL